MCDQTAIQGTKYYQTFMLHNNYNRAVNSPPKQGQPTCNLIFPLAKHSAVVPQRYKYFNTMIALSRFVAVKYRSKALAISQTDHGMDHSSQCGQQQPCSAAARLAVQAVR
jgi:hypothetical protein